MPDSAVRTFTDPDAYNAALRDVQAQGVVTGRGNFRAELATVRLDRLSLQRTQESLPRTTYSAVNPKLFGIIFPIYAGHPIHINGLEMSQSDIIVFRAGSIGHNRSSTGASPLERAGFEPSVPGESGFDFAREVRGRLFAGGKRIRTVRPSPKEKKRRAVARRQG
jgi:hypothetical protein